MNTSQFCIDKAIPPGSNFYYACLYQQHAKLLYPLLALHNELSELVFQSSDLGAARLSLNWWADELGRLQQHQPRHPITQELQQHNLEIDYDSFMSTLAASEMFLQFHSINSYDDWQQHHYQRCETIATHMSGLYDAENHKYIELTGKILACASMLEQLHHLHHLFTSGRQPLPEELLQQHALTMQALLEQTDAQQNNKLFTHILQRLFADLTAYRQTLVQTKSKQHTFSRVLCSILLAQVKAYIANDKNIMQEHISLSPLRKLWIAWRNKY